MRTLTYLQTSLLTFFSLILWSQDTPTEREVGHLNNNKFKQLYEEFSTPNRYRTASGAPGDSYYQQQVDYVMDLELDDHNTIFVKKKLLLWKKMALVFSP